MNWARDYAKRAPLLSGVTDWVKVVFDPSGGG
jgi:hypothetical protein